MKYIQVCFEPMFWTVAKGGSEEMKRRFQARAKIDESIAISYSNEKRSVETKGERYIKKHLSPLVFVLPVPVALRIPSRKMLNLINGSSEKSNIYIEGIQASLIYFFMNASSKERTVIRIHNWESVYHYEMYLGSQSIKRYIHLAISYQYRLYEKILFRYAKILAHISVDEMGAMAKKYPLAHHYSLPPIAKPIINSTLRRGKFDGLLILGDLTISGNYMGAKWFTDIVWPKIRGSFPYLQLHVVGIGSEKIKGNGVISHGFVKDLQEFAESHCLLSIVPVSNGGGVKIKTIDTMVSGLPALYSYKSLEGLCNLGEIKDKLISFKPGDAKEAYEQCSALIEDPDKSFKDAEIIKSYAEKYYSLAAYLENYREIEQRIGDI